MQARLGSHFNPLNIHPIIYLRRQVSLLLKRFVKRAARKRIGDVTAKETGRERRKFMVESHVSKHKRDAFEHVRCDRREKVEPKGVTPTLADRNESCSVNAVIPNHRENGSPTSRARISFPARVHPNPPPRLPGHNRLQRIWNWSLSMALAG